VGAIAGLYVEQRPKARLGMIAAFTATFALSVILLTNARRAEVFAATAALVSSPFSVLFGGLTGYYDQLCSSLGGVCEWKSRRAWCEWQPWKQWK